MNPVSFNAIDRQARRLRAEEIWRLEGLLALRLGVIGRQLGAAVASVLLAIGEGLRPLFSWNPREKARRKSAAGHGKALLT